MKTSTLILVGGAVAFGIYFIAKSVQPAPQTPANQVITGVFGLIGKALGSSSSPKTAPPGGSVGSFAADPAGYLGW